MEDKHKCADQFENLSLSMFSAEEGLRESASTAGTATASDYVTAAASEQATTSHGAVVTANIELSKSHWSECVKIDCSSTEDEIAEDNLRLFESLQEHSVWGGFFHTFGYDTESADSSGEMEVGEKFAEGGQAELFHARITWRDSKYNEYCQSQGLEWVLKVFKKGTLLRELQSQWPQGYLKWWANDLEQIMLGYPPGVRWHCAVMYGALMRDGRFAFVMLKETGDLRTHIDERMPKCGYDTGPFSKDMAGDILYRIARGVDWLHKQNVIHRDIKASNVLITGEICNIADFECSVGVVGTGFWRAPEILQACRDGTVTGRLELFSKAIDAYSFGMTCYEVLTGKYPFEEEGATLSDVINGKQPHIPRFVDAQYKDLLRWCWQLDPASRPTFDEILTFLEANSKLSFVQKMAFERMKVHEGGPALLGCSDPSHSLSHMECARNGSYVCKLCLEVGDGEVYHCNSCGDFEFHPECARVPVKLDLSFLHPHELEIFGAYQYFDNRKCGGCGESLRGSQWVYRCSSKGCGFDLHARCGKYAASISHACHSEHTLLLVIILGARGLDECTTKCGSCKMGIRHNELVYQCKECNFNIHPSCALGKLRD